MTQEGHATPPDQRDPGVCRSCHAEIAWGLTAKGKRMPYNLDGSSHFGTCPEAAQWSRKNQRKR